MFNFLFRLSQKSRHIIALEIANERLRTVEIDEEKGVVVGAKGEMIHGFGPEELPFSVERIAKAVLQSVEKGECVIATHPELSPLCLVSVSFALEGKESRISSQQEHEYFSRALKEAESAALSLEASRTGLHQADLAVVHAEIQQCLIDGYAVERLSGFSGGTIECKVACCVMSKSLENTLSTLTRMLEEKHTLVKVGYEAVVYAERARRANKSGIVVCMGYASSRAYIFRAGRLTDSLPIPWGTRELFSPFRDVFGMEERAAKELLSRYEKKEISEALRKKTRELVLSPFSQFATLIREALSGVADYARLSLELIGEGASIPEAQECLPSFKIRVLVPAHARIPRGSRFSSDSSFTLLAMSALYATHKILDITRRKPPAPAQSGGTALSKTPLGGSLALRVAKILLAGALLGALTGGGLWHIFFASSRITLVPKTRSVTARLVFSADQRRADASIADAAIPAMILSKEKEAVRVFPSTGTREKETYAEGVIRVFNTQANKNQILVANTRFIAANGKLFKTTARVTIPPGSLDVRVKAAEPGESYNIEPTAFSLPGLAGTSLYTVIYGKSAEPMRGGSKITATVVTESDIASAELALEDALVKQAKEMIGGSVPEGYLWLPEFTKHAVVESKPLVKAGAELEQFNVSAKVRVSALVFLRQDAVDLLTNALGRLVSDEEELEGSGISASFAGERFRESEGAADIAGTIEGVAARIIDKELLLSRIQGRHKKEAVAALGSYDPLQESGVEISPFWRQTLPADSSRISFTTRLY